MVLEWEKTIDGGKFSSKSWLPWGSCKYVSCVPQSFDPSQKNVGLYRIGTINILGNSSILWLCLNRYPTSASKWVSHDKKNPGWWFQRFGLFSISFMGCHPKPIDEVHDFSRWLLHVIAPASQNPLKWGYPILRSGKARWSRSQSSNRRRFTNIISSRTRG